MSFQQVTEIDDAEDLLKEDDGETVPNPGDWDTFVSRYTVSDVSYHRIVFVEEDLTSN